MSKKKKIVLAYSGGLDTSVLLSWIKDKHDAEMIAFCADIGQEDELKGLKQKAMKTGASKLYVDDLQAEFARDFIFPMMQASAIYEGQYYLGTSIARPLIAKRMVEIARKEGATAIAHGATGKGQRPGPLRTDLRRARYGPRDHRPLAQRSLPQGLPRPRRDDRLLRRQQDPGRSQRQEAVLFRP